jgi:menaquinone-dependent protoporphyrinogen oxidase
MQMEKTMSERILVAYATRTGSTADVAIVIGDVLRTRGYEVDVVDVTADPSPDGCVAAVIGSAVNGGRWLPEAVDFVRKHQHTLSTVPVAAFTVHIMNAGADERSRRKRLAYLDGIRPLVHPVDEAFFLGIGPDPARDPWLMRWFFRRFGGAGEGDCRNWAAIRGWASTVLADRLAPDRRQPAPDREPVSVRSGA